MTIPGSHIARYIDSIEFPVGLWSKDGSRVERTVNREELVALAASGSLKCTGSATRLRKICLVVPFGEAMRLAEVEIKRLLGIQEALPLDNLMRMVQARKFIHRVHVLEGRKKTGRWYWRFKRQFKRV
jgi:hypothetical protein